MISQKTLISKSLISKHYLPLTVYTFKSSIVELMSKIHNATSLLIALSEILIDFGDIMFRDRFRLSVNFTVISY